MGGGSATEVPETPEQRAQGEVATRQYADYTKRWNPIIEFYRQRTDADHGAERGLVRGQAATDLQGRFSNAGTALRGSLRKAGIEAGSGRDVFAASTMSNDLASSMGGSISNADAGVDKQYLSGLQQIIGIGRNQRVNADASLSSLSQTSGEVAQANAEAAAQEAAGLGEAIGTGIGGAGAYGLNAYSNKPNPSSRPPPGSGAGLSSYPGYDTSAAGIIGPNG